jgi:ABC-type uncharacterized transport system substrate-binding protein
MKKITAHCLVLILLCLPLQLIAKQKILIIESYHSEFVWDQNYIRGIKSVLKNDFDLFYFQMNTKRLPKNTYQERADQAWELFQDINPDLVILGDDNALKYLSMHFSQTTTPVIYLGINNNPRNYHFQNSKNITGVLERPLIKRAISTVAQLLPQKVTRILLMFDNSQTSNTVFEEVFSSNTQISISGIQVEIRLIGNWETWKNKLLSADNNYDAVFFGLYHTLTDEDNNHIPAEQVLLWSAENTPIPPFGFWDFSIGQDKAIGGLVHFGSEQGKLAAEIAKEILVNKRQPDQINTKTAKKGRYLFSRQALQKYGLTLPEKIAKKTIYIE